ncbi:hypothetical protein B0181_11875 [Moraxella caviae]|uniref:Uncharacterized protein n=1 Tax=Moraxella caviae TaxID=34060 RepID=A0A1S9ZQN3_9GAMM|nr:hypothetical protein [Moraxella caviae]OOR85869.1 hypothetical protein B0181_11875 [Moraxella caviae]STZ14480.1 Uncharacterised protein [Moraxella caviae]
MSNKFIIIADEMFSAKTKDAITEYFEKYDVGIWHWVSNVWLIVDKGNALSRLQIRDDLRKIASAGTLLVMEDGICTGFAPSEAGEWIKDNWNKQS